jgi:D-arabinan exo alpha-(1,3)/(1,5)-arabinofuranosidase (non-reducing end)
MKTKLFILILGCIFYADLFSQSDFNGLQVDMSNLYMLSNAKTRSISPENFTGEKGKGGMAKLEDKDKPNTANAWQQAQDLGQGWKVNPYINVKAGESFTLAEIDGPGAIQHIWMTPTGDRRLSILRVYWDDEKEPSIECPIGDFFANGWGEFAQVNSLAVTVNPGSAFNCYWVMPFRKKCKITLTNINNTPMRLYYQIDYVLTEVPKDAAYLHAQFRRVNPLPYKEVYSILDGVKGKGQFVGTYMCWGVNNNGWWGEGEIKFYIDGDKDFPTICGTGAEDYFCGSYNFHVRNPATNEGDEIGYRTFTTAYTGLPQIIRPDGQYRSQMRFGLYRWHITDPVRFEKDLKITIQALGWRPGGYLPLQDDISSVAFWYQTEPHADFPDLPEKKELEIN